MAQLLQLTLPFLVAPPQRGRRLERASKLIAIAAFAVVSGAIYACTIVASDIESAFTQRVAAGTALYVDNVVEPLVQELATQASLSTENQQALERRLAALSPSKPIVAFKLWTAAGLVFRSDQKTADQPSPPSS